MAKCYMCDNDSTSVEHTPPKSFFPANHRNNLLTVPACKEHNEDTSKDDEYVRNIMTMSIHNNKTAIDHFFQKSLKSFQRSPALASSVRNSLKEVSEFKPDAHAFQVERDRFDRTIRKIAYALFYKEYDVTWERLLAVLTNQLRFSDMSLDDFGEMSQEIFEDLDDLELKGENGLVFKYAFFDFGTDPNDKALFLLFYEGFPICVIPDKNSDSNSLD
ncbi:MAG: hypothetical protein ACLGH8_03335 [Bacteroidia bacterium]